MNANARAAGSLWTRRVRSGRPKRLPLPWFSPGDAPSAPQAVVVKAAEEAARLARLGAEAAALNPFSGALGLPLPDSDAIRAHLAGRGTALALATGGLAAGLDVDNPEVVRLEAKLRDVTQRLQRADFGPELEAMDRDGEPAPIYNAQGQRTNTREVVARDRLARSRNDLIETLMAKCPTFRPPPDWRPMKKEKKLYIPQKEYPGATPHRPRRPGTR